jgi:hypothetical protein
MLKLFGDVKPGDLIAVDWCDASTGKSSMNGGAVDVPVRSWGIFLGIVEGKVKHVILAQNSFRFTDSAFDLDYTAIPVGWTVDVKFLASEHVKREVAENYGEELAGADFGRLAPMIKKAAVLLQSKVYLFLGIIGYFSSVPQYFR